MPEEKPEAVIGEFKGSPTITIFINKNENYRFSFGLGKARTILDYLDEIKKFVDDHEKAKEKE